MSTFAFILALFVAGEHIFIMMLEMFFITSKIAERAFSLPKTFLQKPHVRTLFANQGLYNGFLAAGILWWLFFVDPGFQFQTVTFFISCVLCAAVFGSITASKKILLTQGFPAFLTLISLFFQ